MNDDRDRGERVLGRRRQPPLRVVIPVLIAVLLSALVVGRGLDQWGAYGPAEQAASSPAGAAATSVAATPAGAAVRLAGVETGPLGSVRGEYVFVTRNALTGSGPPIAELWAIPLTNGADARPVVRYPGYGTPWLSSRLSPDGRRYAFDADRGDGVRRIAIADLIDGTVHMLKTDDAGQSDIQPAWDPNGMRIAFARFSAGLQGQGSIWVVNIDGSGLKQLVAPASAGTYVHQWTADGRRVAFYQGLGYDIVDVGTGVRVQMGNVVSADASWRTRSPALLARGYAPGQGGDVQTIFTTDDPAGSRVVLVRTLSTSDSLSSPRWRPGTDEFLYGGRENTRAVLRVRSLSGTERTLPVSGGSPTWTTDGSAIVYIRPEEVPVPGIGEGAQRALVTAEIRVIGVDGTGDRLLYRTPAEAGQLPPNWCVCNDALATRRF